MVRVIAICGLKRSGKDTIADIITTATVFQKKSIASTLKEVCKIIFHFNDKQVNGTLKDCIDNRLNITPRRAMQYFGTEIMQYNISNLLPDIGRHFWINEFIYKNRDVDKMVIPDLRFLHEYNELRKHYGNDLFVIRVINNRINDNDDHSSEQEWKTIPYDVCINNNSSLKKLRIMVYFLYFSLFV